MTRRFPPTFAKRRGKFGAIRTTVDGHNFDSKKEARRYGELKLMQLAGAIAGLELQPRFPIVINGEPVRYPSGVAMEYRGDFKYVDTHTRRVVVEDVKGIRKTPRAPGVKSPRHEGTDTDASKIKRALVAAIYGYEVRIV